MANLYSIIYTLSDFYLFSIIFLKYFHKSCMHACTYIDLNKKNTNCRFSQVQHFSCLLTDKELIIYSEIRYFKYLNDLNFDKRRFFLIFLNHILPIFSENFSHKLDRNFCQNCVVHKVLPYDNGKTEKIFCGSWHL